MRAKLTRGKQQVLFNYLPEDTFDFGKLGVLAKVTELSGIENKETECQSCFAGHSVLCISMVR